MTTLLVSGGDDGSLTFLLTAPTMVSADRLHREDDSGDMLLNPPVILTRAHASAVTACVAVTHLNRVFVVTSGNDQWVRVWEVVHHAPATTSALELGSELGKELEPAHQDPLTITRVTKAKTNVADVSSMTLLKCRDEDGVAGEGGGIGVGRTIRVLICGVGMEVFRFG